ncbi:amino acid transporter [Thermoanaerobaculum aquaticum]|uniref:Amino acid transporter n=1 Tax=Thermoanaerobaculum aquaticum TaxID=1312852 RepID=A0A062XKE7_9BACT|nr:amino acid transporter [Thermoanaerobaculum aquaticum]
MASSPTPPDPPSWSRRLKELLFGKPRNLQEAGLVEKLSLVALLAWVGLGADGLSSSCYGPEEAYRTLGSHTYLAIGIAALTAFTVVLIATAYSRIIEEFPHGGGGYVVASKLLGERVGVVSGCALLVDYVLTVAVSVAAACDALFSFLPPDWHGFKVASEVVIILALTVLNIRGVKESVLTLAPIFVLFLLLHVFLIVGGIALHLGQVPQVVGNLKDSFRSGLASLGGWGMVVLFFHAYSMGGGTYTGLEAVSNGLPIMREPRVRTAKRTMLYMAVSLSFTAAGLMVCYLLWGVEPLAGKTLNAVLLESFSARWSWGQALTVATLLSEGALLVVAAQTGFLDGPRVLANMAVDSWVPHRFAALSERLTTRNGILLMGAAALSALLYTHGEVRHLVVMYSINVFLTFTLSMLGMLRLWLGRRNSQGRWRKVALFAAGFSLCGSILIITVVEKFRQGGWVTLAVTGCCIGLAFLIKRHYRGMAGKLAELDRTLGTIPAGEEKVAPSLDPGKPTAAFLVASYSGLGVHTVLNALRFFPGHFRNLVFLSVAVVDSGAFKGEGELAKLRQRQEAMLAEYVALANRLGFAATSRLGVGTDVVAAAEALCLEVLREFPRTVFFAGHLIFRRERWYHRYLHNQTAFALQKRLQWQGVPVVVLPVRVY